MKVPGDPYRKGIDPLEILEENHKLKERVVELEEELRFLREVNGRMFLEMRPPKQNKMNTKKRRKILFDFWDELAKKALLMDKITKEFEFVELFPKFKFGFVSSGKRLFNDFCGDYVVSWCYKINRGRGKELNVEDFIQIILKADVDVEEFITTVNENLRKFFANEM